LTLSRCGSGFDEGDYTGHGVASIFDTDTDGAALDQELLHSPEKDAFGLEMEDDSGIVITALECVLWKSSESSPPADKGTAAASAGAMAASIGAASASSSTLNGNKPTPTASSSSSRIEWTVMVGDSVGRVTLLDITDVSPLPLSPNASHLISFLSVSVSICLSLSPSLSLSLCVSLSLSLSPP
jgi:hypothetical protein